MTTEMVEQRAAERFQVNRGTSCPFVSPVAEDFGAARVLTVSMDGVGLRLARRVEPGALLVIHLTNADKGFARTVLVRVVHATPEPGGCLVGGALLTPLTYQELTTLVL